MDYFRKIFAKVRAVLVLLPPSQRYSIVALMGVVAASLVLLVMWSGRVEYTPALSGLSSAEMSGVQGALKDSKMDYRLADGMLLVRPADKDKVLMALTEKGGLPSDISKSFGFEDLVKPQGFNLQTSEQQQMNYNIALGNMLARSIQTAPEIAKAQVIINASRDGYFGPEKATAAVHIQPRTGEPLSDAKQAAICRFVAAAVGPKLSPQAVVVTNLVTGQAYSIEDQNSAFSKAANRLNLQQNWDKYYSRKVQDFLAPTFGQVQTLVTAAVDTTAKTTKTTEYDTVERKTSSSQTSGSGSAGGETLTQPNVAASVAGGGAPSGAASRTEEEESSKAPVLEATTDFPPGEIKDISISVLVDLARLETVIREQDNLKEADLVAPDRVVREYAVWQAKLMKGLPVDLTSKIVKVEFSAAPFNKLDIASAAVSAAAIPWAVSDVFFRNVHRIGLAVLALVALVMIRSIAKRAAEASVEPPEEDIPLPEPEVDMEQRRVSKMREGIEEMVRRDPQMAVSLIRRWMAREP